MPNGNRIEPTRRGIPIQKMRHRLSPNQRFDRMVSKYHGENPVFPAIMHSLERFLAGATDLSKMDKSVQNAIETSGLAHQTIETWVNNWKNIPITTRAAFVPAELLHLDPAKKIDANVFQTSLDRSLKAFPVKRYLPVPWKSTVKSRIITTTRPDTGRRVGIPRPPATGAVTGITPTEPDGTPYVFIGEPFTIHGSTFSLDNNYNAIYLEGVNNTSITRELIPTQSSPDELQATAPIDIPEGDYYVSVAHAANVIQAYFAKPVEPAPTIDELNPNPQFLGKKVVVTGSGFREDPRVFWSSLESDTTESVAQSCDFLSQNQVSMTVPLWLTPGQYRVAFACKNTGLSEWKVFTVAPYKFAVRFGQMICLDESWPEWWGSDELVTRWVIVADNEAWDKATGEYTGFNDGTRKSYKDSDKKVFIPGNGGGVVKESLYVSTALWEWDAGDAEAWNKTLGFIGDLAKEFGTPGKVAAYIMKFAGWLISWLGGDPDALGVVDMSWTYLELLLKTENAAKSFSGELDFLNGSDTGSYKLTYMVKREE